MARVHAPRGVLGGQCGRWATRTASPPAGAGRARAGLCGPGVCAAKHLPPSPGRKARSGSSEVYRRRAGLRMLRVSARAKGVLRTWVRLRGQASSAVCWRVFVVGKRRTVGPLGVVIVGALTTPVTFYLPCPAKDRINLSPTPVCPNLFIPVKNFMNVLPECIRLCTMHIPGAQKITLVP